MEKNVAVATPPPQRQCCDLVSWHRRRPTTQKKSFSPCPPSSTRRLLLPCSSPAFDVLRGLILTYFTCATPTLTMAFYARRPSSKALSSRVPWPLAVGACRRIRGGVRGYLRPASSRKAISPRRVFLLTLPAPGASRVCWGGLCSKMTRRAWDGSAPRQEQERCRRGPGDAEIS